jgi:TonB family protein
MIMIKRNIIFTVATLFLTVTHLSAVNDMWIGHRYSVEVIFFQNPEANINPPSLNLLSMPDYPIELAMKLIQGTAVICFMIDECGVVCDIRILSADQKDFELAAKKAVEKWSFIPARNTVTGKNVPTKMECSFEFRLSEKSGGNRRG